MDARMHALSIEEKLELIEELWNSIAADQAALAVTDEQRHELDLRLAEFEADGDLGRDATSVLEEIRQRLLPCASGSARSPVARAAKHTTTPPTASQRPGAHPSRAPRGGRIYTGQGRRTARPQTSSFTSSMNASCTASPRRVPKR